MSRSQGATFYAIRALLAYYTGRTFEAQINIAAALYTFGLPGGNPLPWSWVRVEGASR